MPKRPRYGVTHKPSQHYDLKTNWCTWQVCHQVHQSRDSPPDKSSPGPGHRALQAAWPRSPGPSRCQRRATSAPPLRPGHWRPLLTAKRARVCLLTLGLPLLAQTLTQNPVPDPPGPRRPAFPRHKTAHSNPKATAPPSSWEDSSPQSNPRGAGPGQETLSSKNAFPIPHLP